jgi:hypothetical protein
MRSYFKRKKIYKVILSSILLLFFIYSFFTYNGAVRLSMSFVSKNIISPYTTKIEKGFSRGNDNKYFHSKNELKDSESGNTLLDFECKSYFIVKVCKYYGF